MGNDAPPTVIINAQQVASIIANIKTAGEAVNAQLGKVYGMKHDAGQEGVAYLEPRWSEACTNASTDAKHTFYATTDDVIVGYKHMIEELHAFAETLQHYLVTSQEADASAATLTAAVPEFTSPAADTDTKLQERLDRSDEH